MHERLLDKKVEPSFDDLIAYSGDFGRSWLELDEYLIDNYLAQKLIRFPYGKDYGWGVKYSCKGKHICDVFAENNAFTVFLRIGSSEFSTIESNLSDYSKDIWQNKYPCGDGGCINYRILSHSQLNDIMKIIDAKVKPKSRIAT